MNKTTRALLSLLLLTASSLSIASEWVSLQVTAKNQEGGGTGSGYFFADDTTYYDLPILLQDQVLEFADAGVASQTVASLGRFKVFKLGLSTESKGPEASIQASSNGVVIASAPGVAAGEPIKYSASLRVRGQTSKLPLDSPWGGVTLAAGLKILVGPIKKEQIEIRENQSFDKTIRVSFTVNAGNEFWVNAWLRGSAAVGNSPSFRPRPPDIVGLTSANVTVKPARVILISDTPGANITSKTGYTYD